MGEPQNSMRKAEKEKRPISPRKSAYNEDVVKAAFQSSEEQKRSPKLPEKISQAQFLSIVNLSIGSKAPLHLMFCDLTEVNLVGINFRNADLRTCWFKRVSLPRFCFDKSNLAGADFSGAHLQDASFEGANMFRCNLSAVNLSRAKLRGANLIGANLSHADVSDADISATKVARVDFTGIHGFTQEQFRSVISSKSWSATGGAKITSRIIYGGCRFENFDFTRWNLRDVCFSTAKLAGCKFMGADVQGSSFAFAQLDAHALEFVKDLNFENCDLSGIDCAHLRLNGANFKYCNLTSTNFHHSELARVVMENALLSQTNFFGALIDPQLLLEQVRWLDGKQRRSFVGCNLTAQNFSGAKIAQCDFTGAILQAAVLDGAIIQDTMLAGADLRDASMKGTQFIRVFFDGTDMSGAITDLNTNFVQCSLRDVVCLPVAKSK